MAFLESGPFHVVSVDGELKSLRQVNSGIDYVVLDGSERLAGLRFGEEDQKETVKLLC